MQKGGQVSGMKKPVTILSICDMVAHPNYFLKSDRTIFFVGNNSPETKVASQKW